MTDKTLAAIQRELPEAVVTFEDAEPFDPVDPDYAILLRGRKYSIQDARGYAGGWGANEYGGEGADFWSRDLGTFKTATAAARRIAKAAGITA